MKISIESVFKNIRFFLTLLTVLLFLISFFELMRYTSFDKIKNIQEEKELVTKLYELGRDNLDYNIIQFHGMSAELKTDALALNTMSDYDIIGNILGLNKEFGNDINTLLQYEDDYLQKLTLYYDVNGTDLDAKRSDVSNSKELLIGLLNTILFKNLKYDYDKFYITQWFFYLTFISSFLITFWYAKRLKIIYNDIKSLFAIGYERTSESLETQEIDAIKMRMVRKPTTSQNPSMIDPVTGIKNYKGMVHSYSEKKDMKASNYTIVCVFEIDDFRTYEKEFPKEFSQSILKKISFIISLYEQPTDVVARIDYDQFAVIFSRDSKDKALSDCDAIRKSIEETNFKTPKGEKLPLTLSGGLVIKQSNKSLEDTISNAKDILQTAKEKGKNRIAQIRDHAEKY